MIEEIKGDWLGPLRVESVIGQLEITLSIARNHAMTADDKEVLRRLLLHEPGCTAYRLYEAISMLVPSDATGDEFSTAIQKVAWIFDAQIFRSPLWWSGIEAFKKFDNLESSNEIIN